ncbi:hypothetical protein H9Q72_006155 [Fusarium xylarioides]|uniref:BHLH domain-containing protein n=1 Tax=Fusarium xylarioides TaxID=221167 RepID=A0A9P7HSL6_9HYPO|nr:hypothetical protein H9Q72_006155 [Fusarium xylarioides]
MPTHAIFSTDTAQCLPWDVDGNLSPENFSNTSSSPELAEYTQAGYPFNYVPSSDSVPIHDTEMSSTASKTNQCLAKRSQLSTQTIQAPSRSKIQLREASRKPKDRRYQVTSNRTAHVRECHHLAERQYRIRLKAQFESLLAVLPASRTNTLADKDSTPSSGQVLSRGQVLDLARERILELEEDIRITTSIMSNGYPLS